MAFALDLVGERWTLLIVRDLFLGPKRFTDLANGLPGVGTNILTDRLKKLEAQGLVRRRLLPPPAASSVYELTPTGRELEEPLTALAHWGGRHLGVRQPGQTLSVESVKLGLYGLLQPLAAGKTSLLCNTYVEDAGETHCFQAKIAEGAIQLVSCLDAEGEAVTPNVTIYLTVETLFALVGSGETLSEAKARGAIRLVGDWVDNRVSHACA